MRRIRIGRPSPALVIACVALGIVLGGTSFAAVSQLAPNSVGTAQLRAGAVTTPKLRTGAVTTTKIANGTLRRIDFASGQLLVGPRGPAGATGPAGPTGPPGLSGVERVEATSVANSTPSRSGFIACPTGKRLVGGGARLNPVLAQVALQQSYPDNDNVYRASAREINATNASWSLTVFAICANAS